MNSKSVRALLAGSALVWSATALAQQPAGEPAEQPLTEAEADAAIAQAAPTHDANAKIELLQAQVEALQEALEQVKAAQVKNTPTWRGAPQFEDRDAGWTFKPRGRIQLDTGFVANPDDAIVTRNLGFNTRARRLRLGAEGTIPGGFSYKAEMDFAGAAGSANPAVGFGDVTISYAPTGKFYNLTFGNHETLNGLEQISSSRFISFLERAAFNDAFLNTRRIGASFGLANPTNTLRFNAGIFAAHSIDNSFDNEGYIGAARLVYAPVMGGNQLHFGGSFQYRQFQENNGGTASTSQGAPSINQVARYRARPFTQTTDFRFVDTGSYAAKGDHILGLEFLGIFKSLHVTAEGQMLKSRIGYEPGDLLAGLDQFASPAAVTVPDRNPTFWGGYAEVGYFITGETRGYRPSRNGLYDNGTWDRTRVLNPLSKGGIGALQVNARVDYLDLDSSRLKTALTSNFGTGVVAPLATSGSGLTSRLGRGGKQLGLLGGLIWIPEDYFRVLLNYAHAEITGGPQAAVVKPASSKPVDKRKYGVDVLAARLQLDF